MLKIDVINFVVSKFIDVENNENVNIMKIRLNVEIQHVQKHEYSMSTFVI